MRTRIRFSVTGPYGWRAQTLIHFSGVSGDTLPFSNRVDFGENQIHPASKKFKNLHNNLKLDITWEMLEGMVLITTINTIPVKTSVYKRLITRCEGCPDILGEWEFVQAFDSFEEADKYFPFSWGCQYKFEVA